MNNLAEPAACDDRHDGGVADRLNAETRTDEQAAGMLSKGIGSQEVHVELDLAVHPLQHRNVQLRHMPVDDGCSNNQQHQHKQSTTVCQRTNRPDAR
jgi:hypothetical protein